MKTIKRMLAFVLAVGMCLSLFCGSAWAAGEGITATVKTLAAHSGVCGENATWNLDTDSGRLTISGTGPMYDYEGLGEQPWIHISDSIRSVVVESGVTSIGNAAFSDCEKLKSAVIESSVTRIGDNAFTSCFSLSDVTIGKGVREIDDFAFVECYSLKSITIPATVTTIGEDVFMFRNDQLVICGYTGSAAESYAVKEGITFKALDQGSSIYLNKISLSLDVKKTAALKATVQGISKKVTWKSSNTKIATVNQNGKVTAKKRGSCTITAMANGKKASCKVTVTEQWQSAYLAYLKGKKSTEHFHLAYVDNNDVPELVVCDDAAHISKPSLYTYYNGKMRLVSKYGAYGQFAYAPKKNRFYVGNMSHGYSSLFVYQISKGKLKTLFSFNNNEYAVSKKSELQYQINGKKVSKNEYQKKQKSALKGYKYRWAGFLNGFENTTANRQKLISNPKAVTY